MNKTVSTLLGGNESKNKIGIKKELFIAGD
jgi:hypothetical protein